MLLTMMALTIQLAAPAGDPQIEVPDSAAVTMSANRR